MKMRFALLFFFFIFCATTFGQPQRPKIDHPPLKIALYLSGNFGEIRRNHFHTGLDLKTRGSEGYRVYSVWDGYVSRIKVSPYGYGNAIYITHPNGYTSVYAHLQGFSAEVSDYVKQQQYERESYSVNLFPPKNFLNFKAGDVIGLSGNSGSSQGPHLHFEIRESNSEHPINPEAFGIEIKDHQKPSIYGLKIEALSATAGVEKKSHRYYGMGGEYGNYELKEGKIPAVVGPIGISVHTIDKYDDVPNKNGSFKIEMKVDGQTHFECQMKELDFSTNRYMNAFIDYPLFEAKRKKYLKCYVKDNNPLQIYGTLVNHGILNIKPGEIKPVRIIVSDYAGNQSELNFTLKGDSTARQVEEIKEGLYLDWKQDHHIPLKGAQVHIPIGSLYKSEHFPAKILRQRTINMESDVFQIGKPSIALQKHVQLKFSSEGVNLDRLYLATVNDKNQVIGADFLEENLDGWLSFKTRSCGNYALMRDTIAPTVKSSRPVSGKVLGHDRKLFFHFVEKESGLGSYRLEINGQWALMEYDAKRKRFIYRLDKMHLKPGPQELELLVKDNVGNTTVLKDNFIFQP